MVFMGYIFNKKHINRILAADVEIVAACYETAPAGWGSLIEGSIT